MRDAGGGAQGRRHPPRPRRALLADHPHARLRRGDEDLGRPRRERARSRAGREERHRDRLPAALRGRALPRRSAPGEHPRPPRTTGSRCSTSASSAGSRARSRRRSSRSSWRWRCATRTRSRAILNRIGVPEAHTPIAEFREDIRGILDRYLGLKLDEIRTATLLRDLLDLAVRHRIRIPKEYAVLAKASITIEGIIRRLYPKLDVLEVGLPYAKELLLSRFNPSDASGVLMKSLLKLQGLAEDVPSQLSQILVDLEGGKFRVNVAGEAIDRIGGHVRALGVMVFLGLLSAGLTVGGLVVLASRSAPVLGWIALARRGGLLRHRGGVPRGERADEEDLGAAAPAALKAAAAPRPEADQRPGAPRRRRARPASRARRDRRRPRPRRPRWRA